MKKDIILLKSLLESDNYFALRFLSMQSTDKKFDLVKTKFNDLSKEDFLNFLDKLQNLEAVNKKPSLKLLKNNSGKFKKRNLKLAAIVLLGLALPSMTMSNIVSATPPNFYNNIEKNEEKLLKSYENILDYIKNKSSLEVLVEYKKEIEENQIVVNQKSVFKSKFVQYLIGLYLGDPEFNIKGLKEEFQKADLGKFRRDVYSLFLTALKNGNKPTDSISFQKKKNPNLNKNQNLFKRVMNKIKDLKSQEFVKSIRNVNSNAVDLLANYNTTELKKKIDQIDVIFSSIESLEEKGIKKGSSDILKEYVKFIYANDPSSYEEFEKLLINLSDNNDITPEDRARIQTDFEKTDLAKKAEKRKKDKKEALCCYKNIYQDIILQTINKNNYINNLLISPRISFGKNIIVKYDKGITIKISTGNCNAYKDYIIDIPTFKHIIYGDYDEKYACHKNGGHSQMAKDLMKQIIDKKLKAPCGDEFLNNVLKCSDAISEICKNSNNNQTEKHNLFDSNRNGYYTHTFFPEDWDEEKIVSAICQCLKEGNSSKFNECPKCGAPILMHSHNGECDHCGDPIPINNNESYEHEVDGVNVRVIVSSKGKNVITAYPI